MPLPGTFRPTNWGQSLSKFSYSRLDVELDDEIGRASISPKGVAQTLS